jgi:hypothetical protein
MGFDLGMAALAYKGAQEEAKRLRDEEFLQAQRDYLRANWEADASLRDQRTANARKTLNLQGLQTDGAIELQPGETELALTRQRTAQSAADNAATIQPVLNQTASEQADTGLVNAKTAGVKATTGRMAADAEHEGMAQKIEAAVAAGQADADAIRDNMFGHLYGEHPDGDFSSSVRRLQFAADKMPLTFPELAGKQIGSAKGETDADGNKMLVIRDKSGKVLMRQPASAMATAYNRMGKVMTLSDGQNLYQVNGGRATPLTSNKKTVGAGSRGGVGGKGLGGVQGDLVRMLQEDAKARGKPVPSVDEALRMIHANPEAMATRLSANDWRLPAAKTDEERMRYINQNRAAVGLPPLASPGLSGLDPKTQSIIKSVIGK